VLPFRSMGDMIRPFVVKLLHEQLFAGGEGFFDPGIMPYVLHSATEELHTKDSSPGSWT
jgi:hypothetical protein